MLSRIKDSLHRPDAPVFPRHFGSLTFWLSLAALVVTACQTEPQRASAMSKPRDLTRVSANEPVILPAVGTDKPLIVRFDPTGSVITIDGLPLYECNWPGVKANGLTRPFEFSGDPIQDVCTVLFYVMDGQLVADESFKQHILDSLIMANEHEVCQLCGPGSSGCASPDHQYLVTRAVDQVRYLRTILHESGHDYVAFDFPFQTTIGEHTLSFVSYEIGVDLDQGGTYLAYAPEIIADVMSLSSLHWLFDDTVTSTLGADFNQSGYMNRFVRIFSEHPLSPADQEKFDQFYAQFYKGMNYFGSTGTGFEFLRLWRQQDINGALKLFDEAFNDSPSSSAEHGLETMQKIDSWFLYFANEVPEEEIQGSCE